MAEAGYPDGRDAKTGKPLVLNYDYYAPATPERKPEIDWVVRQFAKLDIQLEVRATDNNQFQDKVRKGNYQVFWLGWNWPTTRTPRTSCSCCTARTARRSSTARTRPTTPTRSSTGCSCR